MLNDLFTLTRPLIVLDCETTGLDTKIARIVELGFQLWTAEGLKKEWRARINPGVPIPPETTAVHGITNAHVASCRLCWELEPHVLRGRIDHGIVDTQDGGRHEFHPYPSFKQLAPNIAKGFTDVDFAGKNVRFDLRVLSSEFARASVEWTYGGARIIDADRLEQIGEPRHLSNLYSKHTGKEPLDAHQALADVRMTTEVIAAQMVKYDTLPRDLDALHALQWPGWLDPEGKFRFIDGVPCFGSWGKYAGKPMASVPTDYFDFILKSDFSSDVKALVGQAKLGRFPEQTK